MRKKLDTRFPAARIKKIMQADEDVGKIALAVPVLVSRALELFLQDLCDRTYEITLQRGAKTMSSLHLKHCVQSYNVFDFLREIVSKVPDYSHGHSDQSVDHRSLQKRKPAGEDVNDSEEESKRSRMQETGRTGSSGRGRGRGRGWGRGRGSKSLERESSLPEIEVQHTMSPQHIVINSSIPGAVSNETAEMKESPKENSTAADTNNPPHRKFDLNAEVCYEDVKTTTDPAGAAASGAVSSSADAQAAEPKPEEYPGWSLSDMDKMAIDPVQIAQLGARIHEDEDYDEEG